jgi:hypothetical protein
MPQRRKRTTTALQRIVTLRRIAKNNPRVDAKAVEESMELIDLLRGLGFKGRGYNILESSESTIKVKPTVLSKL